MFAGLALGHTVDCRQTFSIYVVTSNLFALLSVSLSFSTHIPPLCTCTIVGAHSPIPTPPLCICTIGRCSLFLHTHTSSMHMYHRQVLTHPYLYLLYAHVPQVGALSPTPIPSLCTCTIGRCSLTYSYTCFIHMYLCRCSLTHTYTSSMHMYHR